MSSTAEELSAQAEQLQHSVAFFKTNGNGNLRKAPVIAAPSEKRLTAVLARKQERKPRGTPPEKTKIDLSQNATDTDHEDKEFERF